MVSSNLSKRLFAMALMLFSCPFAQLAAATADGEPAPGSADRISLWSTGLAPGDKTLGQPLQLIERSADPALPDR
ncbi:MAG TPA: hypothetical protein VLZ32_03395, partial [Rhodanobacter sp.]|nr:hypothetical protein [Rhodanobacter sp.]